MTTFGEGVLRPHARSVATGEATSTQAIDASLKGHADIGLIRLPVGARVIIVRGKQAAVSVVEPERRVSEVAALLRRGAPKRCGVVAEIGLSSEG